jgi:hypothetical protein
MLGLMPVWAYVSSFETSLYPRRAAIFCGVSPSAVRAWGFPPLWCVGKEGVVRAQHTLAVAAASWPCCPGRQQSGEATIAAVMCRKRKKERKEMTSLVVARIEVDKGYTVNSVADKHVKCDLEPATHGLVERAATAPIRLVHLSRLEKTPGKHCEDRNDSTRVADLRL